MKNFALIFLMCFSLGLEGSKFTPVAPARQQATSALAQIQTAQADLSAYSKALSGLLDQFETTMCGATSSLSINPGGTLNIDSSGNYTNCNGGDSALYNSVETILAAWLAELNMGSYHAGSTDCASKTGILAQSAQVLNNIESISTDINNIVNLVGQPNSYGQVFVNATGAVVADGISTTVTVNGLGDAISATMNNINTYLNATAVLNALTAFNNAITNENAAFNDFYNCQMQAYNAGSCYSNYNANTYSCDGGPCATKGTYWCPQSLVHYLIALQELFPYGQALYALLLKYQPTDLINSDVNQMPVGRPSVVPQYTLDCYYPNIAQDPLMLSQGSGICNSSGCSVTVVNLGNSGGSECTAANVDCTNLPSTCTGTLNGYVCGILSDVNAISALNATTTAEFTNSNLRTKALMNFLATFAGNPSQNVTGKITTITNLFNSVVKLCQVDISKEQAYLGKISMGLNIGLGLLLGAVAFTGVGALGIVGLSDLLMGLTQVPAINNVTLGKLTDLISTQIINNVVVPSEPKN